MQRAPATGSVGRHAEHVPFVTVTGEMLMGVLNDTAQECCASLRAGYVRRMVRHDDVASLPRRRDSHCGERGWTRLSARYNDKLTNL